MIGCAFDDSWKLIDDFCRALALADEELKFLGP
jgi:hypothetical protein